MYLICSIIHLLTDLQFLNLLSTSCREQASSASGKPASSMSSDEKDQVVCLRTDSEVGLSTWTLLVNVCLTYFLMQRQMSARILMPPPRALPSSRNHSAKKFEVSTCRNTSNGRSGAPLKSRGSLNSRADHSSNLSSNSDARKPRRKRRPKKKKQVWLNPFNWCCHHGWSMFSFCARPALLHIVLRACLLDI